MNLWGGNRTQQTVPTKTNSGKKRLLDFTVQVWVEAYELVETNAGVEIIRHQQAVAFPVLAYDEAEALARGATIAQFTLPQRYLVLETKVIA